jgi:hypothetical protein
MPEPHQRASSLDPVSASATSPIVTEVLHFEEELPLGSRGSRRAMVPWSDGSQAQALRWYADLCGHPHTSAYADLRVMPRGSRDRLLSAGAELEGSA